MRANCTGGYLRNCTGTDRAAATILPIMIPNSRVLLAAGPYEFTGTLELEAAPVAVAWLVNRFPLEGTVRHASWSGEAAWLPLGGAPQLAPESATAYPRPGQILLYAGMMSEAELLIAYGACAFASKAGSLAGSPVVTLDSPLEDLRALGSLLIGRGVQPLKLNWLQARRDE
jgi:Protein of unknown function (DUF3830)